MMEIFIKYNRLYLNITGFVLAIECVKKNEII